MLHLPATLVLRPDAMTTGRAFTPISSVVYDAPGKALQPGGNKVGGALASERREALLRRLAGAMFSEPPSLLLLHASKSGQRYQSRLPQNLPIHSLGID